MKDNTAIKLKAGDLSSFEKVYDLYFQKIYQFVFFKINDQQKTEDICSEVFLRFVKFVKENNIDNVSAILYRIARNLIIDDSRKETEILTEDEILESIKDESELNIDDKFINNESLMNAISELSDDYRDVIIMRYINDVSVKDIAEVFHKSEGAIKVTISRALNRLREILEK